jgi:pimeloyl-ACP methyl ester carboxylesterase
MLMHSSKRCMDSRDEQTLTKSLCGLSVLRCRIWREDVIPKAASTVLRLGLSSVCLLILATTPEVVSYATAQERTINELKVEVEKRAQHDAYPVEGLKLDEVREVLGHLTSLDPDEWAEAWSVIGDRHMTAAKDELSSSPDEADKNFVQAWHYYNFARWPAPTSRGKERAYGKAIQAYLAHGRLVDPPIELVHIPFEGKQIVAYVQMPKSAQPAPIVIVIPGLDRGKEDMAELFRALLGHGIGYLALDPPGTGEAPIKAAPGSERMLVEAIHYALQRPDVDKSRVIVYGASFGGFWATLLASKLKSELCGVVAQSPPVHDAFQRSRTLAMVNNREYLFGYVPAYLFMFGVTTLDQLAEVREQMSLKTQGFLDKPVAPMLVVGGSLDSQVPISDIDLLLNSGQTPKDAWINPQGFHMGRDAKGWSGERVFKTVVMPWIIGMVRERPGTPESCKGE